MRLVGCSLSAVLVRFIIAGALVDCVVDIRVFERNVVNQEFRGLRLVRVIEDRRKGDGRSVSQRYP